MQIAFNTVYFTIFHLLFRLGMVLNLGLQLIIVALGWKKLEKEVK